MRFPLDFLPSLPALLSPCGFLGFLEEQASEKEAHEQRNDDALSGYSSIAKVLFVDT